MKLTNIDHFFIAGRKNDTQFISFLNFYCCDRIGAWPYGGWAALRVAQHSTRLLPVNPTPSPTVSLEPSLHLRLALSLLFLHLL